MPYQTYIFASKHAALAALAVFARSDAVLPTDPRPRVTVSVAIEGAEYAGNLRNDRTVVAGALAESLRASLGRRFGFMNWDASGGPAQDTVQVVWSQLPISPRNGYLNVRVRGASRINDTLPIFFERIGTVLDRTTDEWAPPALSRRWSHDADSIFTARQDQVMKTLFSNLPLAVKVRFDSPARLAFISLTPNQIHAAGADQEEFLVRLLVRDSVSQGPGWVALAGCNEGVREAALVCEMRDFTYRGRTASAESRQKELRALKLSAKSVHIIRHTPASVSTGQGGVVESQ